ncbi:hypothetical protein [Candidatus Nitrospira inopinata]|uniref:Uncharacterized protein n=1 Tax=Candidatus Nitrospira inopinata TaxID=1715989 RepID=A0A0S4KT26_9BACT|nr:hypothetical protein [Candidatus Nitrospira inopinata]CUQ66314.1 protein of unknown function [Candidatus Nitrospira inopinata]
MNRRTCRLLATAKPRKEGNKGPVITLFRVPITLFLRPVVQYALSW